MNRWSLFLLCIGFAQSFCPVAPPLSTAHRQATTIINNKRVPFLLLQNDANDAAENGNLLQQVWRRTDTLEASGINQEYAQNPPLASRGFGMKRWLLVALGAFLFKWYRARFINKIPVWDRQPQWNTVVTTKEQEEQLRAYTCLNCGSTLFIARNREWFFEGKTGIGELGCYNCGVKGEENFVMDRERIVEEVGDDDADFEYEKPLDFVSPEERKALLEATGGDEDAANEILVAQAAAEAAEEAKNRPPVMGATETDETTIDAEIVDGEQEEEGATEEIYDEGARLADDDDEATTIQDDDDAQEGAPEAVAVEEEEPPQEESQPSVPVPPAPVVPEPDPDDFDALGI